MNPISLEQESKEIIEDLHAINERFFNKIIFPYLALEEEIPFIPVMINDAYSEDEIEYKSEDLIWKNPKYDPSR